MNRLYSMPLLLSLVIASSIAACGTDKPVTPANRAPVISSLTAFPATIDSTDSVIVVCDALDPDGDSLVYDWISDGRLRISGALPNHTSAYSTTSNSRVVYFLQKVTQPIDTARIQCFARDRRGDEDVAIVRIIMP